METQSQPSTSDRGSEKSDTKGKSAIHPPNKPGTGTGKESGENANQPSTAVAGCGGGHFSSESDKLKVVDAYRHHQGRTWLIWNILCGTIDEDCECLLRAVREAWENGELTTVRSHHRLMFKIAGERLDFRAERKYLEQLAPGDGAPEAATSTTHPGCFRIRSLHRPVVEQPTTPSMPSRKRKSGTYGELARAALFNAGNSPGGGLHVSEKENEGGQGEDEDEEGDSDDDWSSESEFDSREEDDDEDEVDVTTQSGN
ncbi:hypothetical protein B0H63DRAFT_444082 [Podospora didyma]|uniref:Uncharacterized protein n=1 Tax=Podospora didyma TaxID=330526 RepID=A0AAE0U7X3_9PEZI|nr:hypothetical protein B0H63DRAFT_444082 [Podospora didyma]